ncbi:hypothetical protein [Paracoccus beibuensis]|uniref:hypothetical protein n=1 Tax=Paracoccus beibuensis TaxID=547602 RepID=UPI00223F91ED|nr:hypothetical protein [Paracoccus beibuensis]
MDHNFDFSALPENDPTGRTFGAAFGPQINAEVDRAQEVVADNLAAAGRSFEGAGRDWAALMPALVYRSALMKAQGPTARNLSREPDIEQLIDKRSAAEELFAAYELDQNRDAATGQVLSNHDRMARTVRLHAVEKHYPGSRAKLNEEVAALNETPIGFVAIVSEAHIDRDMWMRDHLAGSISNNRRRKAKSLELTD